eukprot:912754-Pyramimonas_sp.AAC.1
MRAWSSNCEARRQAKTELSKVSARSVVLVSSANVEVPAPPTSRSESVSSVAVICASPRSLK